MPRSTHVKRQRISAARGQDVFRLGEQSQKRHEGRQTFIKLLLLVVGLPCATGILLGPADVAGLAMLTTGALLTVGMPIGHLLWQARVRRWTPVPCYVQSVRIQLHAEKLGVKSYRPAAHYTYTVDDTRYGGWRVRLSPAGMRRATAERLIEPYQSRGRAVCYVNPRRPWESVLLRQIELWTPTVLLMMCVAALLTIFG